ncbi:4260_t:CDS:1 [Acaulospora morrowiae]|uniref:4260_t:CDS:1 n=1 Tax=Acaulospora morrowiae TaxID=94023 RepID=A0A9N8VGG8_9GLOM|nr:4260_t:CDS:1 [Acaulospora morrowiae]
MSLFLYPLKLRPLFTSSSINSIRCLQIAAKKKVLPRFLPEIQADSLRYTILSNKGKERRRLAFLGDRTINFHLTLALHEQCPEITNAELFQKVSRLISREELSKIARYIGLDSMVLTNNNTTLSNGTLGETMEAYIAGLCLEGKEREIRNFANKMVKRYLLLENINNMEKELFLLAGNREEKRMIERQLKVPGKVAGKGQSAAQEVKTPERVLIKKKVKASEKPLKKGQEKTPGKLLVKEQSRTSEKSLTKGRVNTPEKSLTNELAKNAGEIIDK